MNIKKYLPQAVTLVLSAVLLIFAIASSSVKVDTVPFVLMEKTGVYTSGDGSSYGIMNDSFSLNGTHEALISIMKKAAANNTVNAIIPTLLLGVLLIISLIYAVSSASKTSYKWTVILCAVLLPVVFCDFLNLVYFKTLFIYPLILILTLLICAAFNGFYKKEKAKAAPIILITAAVIIYSCLGTIQALTAIVFGVLIIRLSKLASGKTAKCLAAILGAVVVIQSLVFMASYKSVDYRQNLYNSVFYGVCKYDSVTELGLDKRLDDFREVYYGTKSNEQEYDLENTFYSKISYKKIIGYYVTHPVNFFKLLNENARAAFYTENDLPFNAYSTVKKLYVPTGLACVLVISAVYILVSVFIRKKYDNLKYVAEFSICLPVIWLLALIGAAVTNGACEIWSTMYTFNVIFDIMLVFALIGGIRIMLKSRDEKKKEFGITHE